MQVRGKRQARKCAHLCLIKKHGDRLARRNSAQRRKHLCRLLDLHILRQVRRIARNAENRCAGQGGGTANTVLLRDERPALLRADVGHIRLQERHEMQLRGVLDKEWKRHEGERRLGFCKLLQTTRLGRIVGRAEAAGGPLGGGGRGGGKSIKVRLSIAGAAGITGRAEHQRYDGACQ